MEKIASSSKIRMIDLKNMNEITPLPPPPSYAPPALVIGASADQAWARRVMKCCCVVDVKAVEELAEHWGVQPVVLDGMAHDMMLVSSQRALLPLGCVLIRDRASHRDILIKLFPFAGVQDTKWEDAAATIYDWLNERISS
eukprot:scaffold102480_cov17-Prasinocladus_malaysianus.AAC.1